MDLREIVEMFEQHGIQRVKLAGADVDGVLRGKYVSLAKFARATERGFGFCDVIFGWDVEDATYDFASVTGWEKGFPDALARVDLDTLRLHPWEPGVALFLCDFWEDEATPFPVCPRNLLKKVLARAAALGYRVRAGFEYEFWLFQETPDTLAKKGFRGLTPLSSGSFGYSVLRAGQNSDLVHDLLNGLAALQVEVEGLHTETGPGVYEAALAATDGLEAADRAVLFKTAVKEIALRHGCVATFMARWSGGQPGSSGHIHQSLWEPEEGGANLFQDAEAPGGMSDVLDRYVAGQVELLPEWTALFAPTINSYRRLTPGFWAPTSATWGVDNRTVALRVIPGVAAGQARVEHRAAGADANPYLALAGCLASGLYGLEHELRLSEPVTGNAYEADAPRLPGNLEQAAAALGISSAAREYFGAEFVNHFVATRNWEVRRFEQAVTDWELRRYFEII